MGDAEGDNTEVGVGSNGDGAVAGAFAGALADEVAGAVAVEVAGALSGLYFEMSANENNRDIDQNLFKVELNLSRMCQGFIEPAIFDENLTHLNLSHNALREVPKAVLALKNIVKLDVSNNLIERFDDKPMFITTIEQFTIANNSLVIPPLWLWKDAPKKLKYVNLSENQNMVSTLKYNGRIEYSHCWLNVNKIVLFNCQLHNFTDVLYTLTGVHELILGGGPYSAFRRNDLFEFPIESLYCADAKIIILNNCKIYDINKSITSYSKLTHLDIGMNYIVNLPEEIGELKDLEVLIVSSNRIEGVPESIINLKKLRILLIPNNRIEQLPKNLLKELPLLKCLDLYENYFFTLPKGHENLDEFDFSQNFATEPEEPEYIAKRTGLRNRYNIYNRTNGIRMKSAPEDHRDESDGTEYTDESDESPMEPPSADILPLIDSIINAP